MSVTSHDDEAAAERYRAAVSRRRRLTPGLTVVLVLLLCVLAYATWAAWSMLHQEPLSGTVRAYQVVSDTEVEYDLVVNGPADTRVRCAVVARSDDFTLVGQDEQALTLGTDGQARATGTVTTLRRAVNAEPGACVAE